MAELQCKMESESSSKVATPVLVPSVCQDVDCETASHADTIPVPEGPLDVNILMDLGFIKRTLDNLVSPQETQAVLDMAVEYIKHDTSKSLETQRDNAKGLEARLTVIDKDREKVKDKLLKCQDKVTLLKETVTENQTKLKSVIPKSSQAASV